MDEIENEKVNLAEEHIEEVVVSNSNYYGDYKYDRLQKKWVKVEPIIKQLLTRI